MSWFYLSFVDISGHRDEFLGGVYVPGETGVDAIREAHACGVNPGGEVAFVGPIDDAHMDANVPEADRRRLLSREELR